MKYYIEQARALIDGTSEEYMSYVVSRLLFLSKNSPDLLYYLDTHPKIDNICFNYINLDHANKYLIDIFKVLDLSETNNDLLEHINHLSLAKINAYGCGLSRDNVISLLNRSCSLDLSKNNIDIDDAVIQAVSGSKSIIFNKKLEVHPRRNKYKNNRFNVAEISKASKPELSNCIEIYVASMLDEIISKWMFDEVDLTNIRYLDISGAKNVNALVEYMTNNVTIRPKVFVSSDNHIDCKLIKKIMQSELLSNCETLDISDSNFDEKSVAQILESSDNIKNINLGRNHISQEFALSFFSSEIESLSLFSLDLSGFFNDSMSWSGKHLSLRDCKIGDDEFHNIMRSFNSITSLTLMANELSLAEQPSAERQRVRIRRLDLSFNKGICCNSIISLFNSYDIYDLSSINLSVTSVDGKIFDILEDFDLINYIFEISLANTAVDFQSLYRFLNSCKNKKLYLVKKINFLFNKIPDGDKATLMEIASSLDIKLII